MCFRCCAILSLWKPLITLQTCPMQEAGFTYLLDWCHDDQPVWMRTRGGRILSIPYSQVGSICCNLPGITP